MRVVFTPVGQGLQLFVRLDPDGQRQWRRRVGNGGADDATVDASSRPPVLVASDLVTATNAANRDYAQPVFAALDGPSRRRRAASSAARATGSLQLDTGHALTPTFPDARDGNVVGDRPRERWRSTDRCPCPRFRGDPRTRRSGRPGVAGGRLHHDPGRYKKAWKTYDATLTRPRPRSCRASPGAEQKKLEEAYY
jgi:hypothetical protein